MQQKLDWEKQKAYMEQQLKEQASNDIDQWEIPPEDDDDVDVESLKMGGAGPDGQKNIKLPSQESK